jgi:RHS repeat-associated protein
LVRTAPAPNLIAIPGMNPGTWVMGGGAGGGGSGGGNGDGTDGAGGAPGDNDGQPGEGNGNNTGSCGQGGAGACTNCSEQTAAGDPIDVLSGEVFTGWKSDLFLTGFFNLDFRRRYSTNRLGRDVGLGFGWVHALAWELHEEVSQIVLFTGHGGRLAFPILPEVGSQASVDGWALVRTDGGYLLRPGSEFFHAFVPDPENGHVFRLGGVRFRRRGQLTLAYHQGRLASVTDTAGRLVVLEPNAEGRVARLVVRTSDGQAHVFARYAYDADGNLVEVTDADGFVTRYRYDDAHRLTELQHPTDLTYHFRYDERGRGVESWGDGPSVPPALAADAPAFLADGTTPARGVLHVRLTFFDDGTSEVVDSVRFQRFFPSSEAPGLIDKAVDSRGGVTTRVVDDRGHVLSHEDPTGAVWAWTYDQLGEVVREVNPEGRAIQFDRDLEGRVTAITDAAGGFLQLSRDPSGEVEWVRDQRGGTALYRLDGHGLPIEIVDRRGATTRVTFDAAGNPIERVDPSGVTHRYTYDSLGRVTSHTDALGQVTRYTHTLAGKLRSLVDPLNRRTTLRYDGLGHPIEKVDPDGAATTFVRGGDGWLVTTKMRDGALIERRYNREGWLQYVENERRERYSFGYDEEGHCTEQRTFDGRVRRYQHDARGRVIGWEDASKGKTELERDLLGRIVKRTLPSGGVITHAYDVRGELIATATPELVTSVTRDAGGHIVREEWAFDGVEYSVDSQIDPEGGRTAYVTSLGHTAQWQRDATGRPAVLWSDDLPALRVERDPRGLPARKTLADGGVIHEAHDEAQRVVSRRVTPAGQASAASAAPAWVGEEHPATIEKQFRYTPIDELAGVASNHEGDVVYRYDLRRHVLEKSANGETREAFRVDETGNYHPTTVGEPSREYGAGGQLLRRGNAAYVYDAEGFLREKIVKDPNDNGAVVERTRYAWDETDQLASIDLPDGRRVRFLYDPFARRVSKRVLRVLPDGTESPLAGVHYVWDGTQLRHEVRFDVVAGTRAVRTYLHEDRDAEAPFAQHEDNKLVYFVGDLAGTPEEVVDGHGQLLGRLPRSVFGVVQEGAGLTPVRFPGQIADEETGLHYNRYRYYDPQLGRFLSPDPLGLEGGLNPFAFGPNPVGWYDPLGLTHLLTVVTSQIAGIAGESSTDARDGRPYDSTIDRTHYPNQASRATCHTERKLIQDIRDRGGLNGTHMVVEGQLPPCPNCHRAMQALGRDGNGGSLTYQWGDPPNTITYPTDGGTPPTGPHGPTLVEAYGMTPTGTGADGVTPLHPNGYAFRDGDGNSTWSSAWQAYRNAQ